MIKRIITVIFVFVAYCHYGQVGVGTVTPNAALDISSSDKGLLIPRVSLVSKNLVNPVVNPQGGNLQIGTLVFNQNSSGVSPNNVIPGFYYWDGTQWVMLSTSTVSQDWSVVGNGGTVPGTNFIGTTDAADFVTRTNNVERMRVSSIGKVGIGTVAPITKLQVNNSGSSVDGVSVRANADWDAFMMAHDGTQAYLNASGAENGIAIRTNSLASGNASTNAYTEQMRILNNGNVGIGTSAPTSKLHVNGPVRIVDGNQAVGKVLTSDANGNASWQPTNVPDIAAFQNMVIPICNNVVAGSTGSFVVSIRGVNTTVSWTVLSRQQSFASFPLTAERLQVRYNFSPALPLYPNGIIFNGKNASGYPDTFSLNYAAKSQTSITVNITRNDTFGNASVSPCWQGQFYFDVMIMN